MSIINAFLYQCKCQPARLALCAPGTIFNSITYGQLEQFIFNIAARVRQRGVSRGDTIALFIKDPILHAAFILALTKEGIVSLSASEQDLPKQVPVNAVFADRSYPADNACQPILVDEGWATGNVARVEANDNQGKLDDVCRILLTSGTTGYPKAISLTTKMAITRISYYSNVCGADFAESSRIFLDMGFSTSFGFLMLIYTISRGGTLFLRGSAVKTIEALSTYRVEALVASPKGLAEFAELSANAPGFPTSFKAIISTGSLLTKTLSEQARAYLGASLMSVYGSTEVGFVAAAPARSVANIEGAVGYVTPGATVDIVDESGARLPIGKEGLIRIRTDTIANGYVGEPPDTQSSLRQDGFYPGDIGTVTNSGIVVIRGRENALINLGGDKVSPERIEAALTSFSAVRDAAIFSELTPLGVPRLGGAIVWHAESDVTGLIEHLRRRLPAPHIPKLIVKLEIIPRNAAGKIDRKRLIQVIEMRNALDVPKNCGEKPN